MNKVITSLQNPLIKQLLLLREKSRERRKTSLTVIEGTREISLAMKAGYRLTTLLYCSSILPLQQFLELFPQEQISCTVTEISVEVFNRLAYRKDSGGVIACAKTAPKGLSDLLMPEQPVVLVLESVEKPGNLGAILRTADAAGISAIILCDPQTDLFHPNTIRASLGTLFTTQVVSASSTDTIAWLKEKGIRMFAAALTGNTWYHEVDFTVPVAIIMGSEAFGLSETWLSAVDARIKIPMQGKVDSLNVSSSAAILVFEAMRQRGFICTSRVPASGPETL
ncbi:MAG: RNA methyltransferase [Bacteroidales bacterium]|nr:RNA methyltransferase [Bacteroidales bacterium]